MPFRVFNLLLSIALSSSGLAASSSFKFLQHTLGTNSSAAMFLTCICLLCGFLFLNSICRRPRLLRAVVDAAPAQPVAAPQTVPTQPGTPRKVPTTKMDSAFGWYFYLDGKVIRGRTTHELSDAELMALPQKEKVEFLGEAVVITGSVEYDPGTFTKERTLSKLARLLGAPSEDSTGSLDDLDSVLFESLHVAFIRIDTQVQVLMTPMVTELGNSMRDYSKSLYRPKLSSYFKLSNDELSQIEDLFLAHKSIVPERRDGAILTGVFDRHQASMRVVPHRGAFAPYYEVSRRVTSLDGRPFAPVSLSNILCHEMFRGYPCSYLYSIRPSLPGGSSAAYKEACSRFYDQDIKLDLDDPRLAKHHLTRGNIFNLPQQTISELSRDLCDMLNERGKKLVDKMFAEGGLTVGPDQIFGATYNPHWVYSGRAIADRSLLPTQIQLQKSRLAGPDTDGSGYRDTTPYLWVNYNDRRTAPGCAPHDTVPNSLISRLVHTKPELLQKL